jgi:excisionase family DNA binding protein
MTELNARAVSQGRAESECARRIPESRLTTSSIEKLGETSALRTKSPECPIGPEEAAAFLKVARSTVMALARSGRIPAHPITNGKRKRWLFFISELAVYVRALGVNCGSHPCAS